MKRALLVLPFLFAAIISCDKVDNPIVKREVIPVDTTDTTGTPVLIRKTFVEEFTGQDCPNCPDGAEALENFHKNQYPNIITVAIHSGDLSKPINGFTNDFRTYTGNFLTTNYKIQLYPSALINRKKYSGNFIWSASGHWSTSLAQAAQEPYIAGLQPTVKFDASSREITSSVKIKFKNNYTGSIRACAMITEDSIVGKQNDKGDHVEDYVFNHVLRGTIGDQDVWGKLVPGAPYGASTTYEISFPNMILNSSYKEKKCSVVIFALDDATKEVLQVEKVKLIP